MIALWSFIPTRRFNAKTIGERIDLDPCAPCGISGDYLEGIMMFGFYYKH